MLFLAAENIFTESEPRPQPFQRYVEGSYQTGSYHRVVRLVHIAAQIKLSKTRSKVEQIQFQREGAFLAKYVWAVHAASIWNSGYDQVRQSFFPEIQPDLALYQVCCSP